MKIGRFHPLYELERAIMSSVSEEEIDIYIAYLRADEALEGDQPYPINRDHARAMVSLSRINTVWVFEKEKLEDILKIKRVK
jgi:hypothetical protein